MPNKRFTAGLMFLIVLICPLVAARESDGPILAKVGRTTWDKVRESLPDRAKIAGPLAAFRAGDALPIEERVRLRIETDKPMDGVRVMVVPGDEAGHVRLRGFVPRLELANRAKQIAESTTGVVNVINELAVPEAK